MVWIIRTNFNYVILSKLVKLLIYSNGLWPSSSSKINSRSMLQKVILGLTVFSNCLLIVRLELRFWWTNMICVAEFWTILQIRKLKVANRKSFITFPDTWNFVEGNQSHDFSGQLSGHNRYFWFYNIGKAVTKDLTKLSF